MKKAFAGLAALAIMTTAVTPAYAVLPDVPQVTAAADTLDGLIASCNALDETLYTEASWKVLDAALAAGEALGEDADADAVAAARSAIESARDALVLSNVNLALNKPVSVSGLEDDTGRFIAEYAVDGDAATRLSFAKDVDEQWMILDLEEEKTISHISINYESTAPSFEIQVSADGQQWESVYSASGLKGMDASVQTIDFAPVSARYVKYVQHERWTHPTNGRKYSGSIYEFEVYAKNPNAKEAPVNLALRQNVTVSGLEVNDGRFTQDLAVDGDPATRVSFAKDKDEQWLLVDLQYRRTISYFVINYESQCPSFKIQVSNDGEHFTDVAERSDIPGQVSGIQKVSIEPVKARYVRYVQNKRWLHSGNGKYYSGSIYEFEIYKSDPNSENAAACILEDIAGQAPVIENGKLVLPEVPEGYSISLYGNDNKQVVRPDLTINTPLEDMTVHVLYEIKSLSNPEDIARSSEDITFVVPGQYQESESVNARPSVMPGLREWKGNEGSCAITDASRIVISDASLQKTAEQLKMYLSEMAGRDPEIVTGQAKAGDIVLILDESVSALGDEGCTMNIDDTVEIRSSAAKGLLYGGVSITQILSQDAAHSLVPKGLVRDYPKYEVRSGMLDVARTYVPMDYLKEMVRYMAYFKLNEVQVHINDYWGATKYSAFRLESETYPDITAKDGSYSKDEYRDFQIEMKDYGIDVITELDTPYHSECFRNVPGVTMLASGALDIREQSSYEIVENLMDEYLDGENPVIQSENFHIGTDEYDKKYSEEMRAWTDHFIKYVNAKGYNTRLWGSLGSRGFKGETPVTNEATVNLWAPYWADVPETFAAGYDIINTCGGWLYIVPGANAGYPDRLNIKSLYDNFEVNNFAPSRNYGQGTAIMPYAHPQTKGAEFCVWNDMTSFGGGFSWFDIYDRFKDAVMLISEKTWYGEKTDGQTSDAFVSRASALNAKAPNSNPGRVVDSQSDLVGSYSFDENLTDASGNSYDGTGEGIEYVSGRDGKAAHFDGTSYASLPNDAIGYPYTVSFDLKIDADCAEDAVLFDGHDGRLVLNVADTGKLGYERCGYQFSFDYTVPKDEWVHITLAGDAKNTTLYVNGAQVSIGTNLRTAINNRKDSNTYMFTMESIMKGAKGSLDNLKIYNRVLSAAEIADDASRPDVVAMPNLALNQPASCSSVYPDRDWGAEKAVDGVDQDTNSRWGSKRATGSGSNEDSGQHGTKTQWLMVDLGAEKRIDTVSISWEAAYAKGYMIQGSLDGETFFDIHAETAGKGGKEVHSDLNAKTRYVRILCTDPFNANWGYSIYELEVYAGKQGELLDLADALSALIEGVSAGEGNGQMNAALLESCQALIAQAQAVDASVSDSDYLDLKGRLEEAIGQAKEGVHTDIAGVQALYASLKALQPGGYTAESFAAFTEVLNAISEEEVASVSDWKQVEALYARLSEAKALLVRSGIASLLAQTIAYAEAVDLDGIENLNPIARSNFEQALAQAKEAYNGGSDQEMKDAWSRLSQAIQMLEFRSDKSELAALIVRASDIDRTLYTADSLAVLDEAITRAEAVMNDDTALTEISIRNAVNALNAALEGLQTVQDFDLTALRTLVESVKDIDRTLYVESGLPAFEEALANAQSVLADPQSQARIDGALGSLHQAWLDLRLKPSEELLQSLRDLQAEIAALLENEDYASWSTALHDMNARLNTALSNPDLSKLEAENLQSDAEALLEKVSANPTGSLAASSASSVKTAAATGVAGWMAAAFGALLLGKRRNKKK